MMVTGQLTNNQLVMGGFIMMFKQVNKEWWMGYITFCRQFNTPRIFFFFPPMTRGRSERPWLDDDHVFRVYAEIK